MTDSVILIILFSVLPICYEGHFPQTIKLNGGSLLIFRGEEILGCFPCQRFDQYSKFGMSMSVHIRASPWEQLLWSYNQSLSLPSLSEPLWNCAAALVGPAPVKGLARCFCYNKECELCICVWCPAKLGPDPELRSVLAQPQPTASPAAPGHRDGAGRATAQLPARGLFIFA